MFDFRDPFGFKARVIASRARESLHRQEQALEKAALELRILRNVVARVGLKEGERFSISDRKEALDESYLRVMAYLFIAQEDIRVGLGKSTFYNIRTLYPPTNSDDDSVADFTVSLRRHLFG